MQTIGTGTMGPLSRPGPPAPFPVLVPFGDCDCRVAGRGRVSGEELPEDGRRVAPHPQLDPRRTPSQVATHGPEDAGRGSLLPRSGVPVAPHPKISTFGRTQGSSLVH